MKYIILLIGVLLFFSSCDQSLIDSAGSYRLNSYKGKYLGQFEEGSTVLKEHYHQTIERTTDGKYIRKQFYPPTKQLTHFETYSDKRLSVRDGLTKEWMDNGNSFKEGNYTNGKMEGEWKHYNINGGHLSSQGKYVAGLSEGIWKYLRKEGTISSEYTFKNGKKHGAYKLFDKKGTLMEEGTYKNGERDQQNILVKSESGEIFKIVERMPMFKDASCQALENEKERKKCAETAMLKFIYSNIKYPSLAREEGIEGTSYVSFVIDKEGNITERKVNRGLCLDVANEVSRIVDMMPQWIPGTQRGEPVKVYFNLPVRFKLN